MGSLRALLCFVADDDDMFCTGPGKWSVRAAAAAAMVVDFWG